MILITGAAGFIGKRIASCLQSEPLILVDDDSKRHICEDIEYKHYYDYISFMEKLYTSPEFAQYIANNVDTIYHQGACSDTTNYDVGDMMYHNYDYSKGLLDFAMEHNIGFIYASSAATYGHGLRGFSEDENHENPLNVYARSKHAFDEYVRCYLTTSKNQIVGLRYFNVYGPGEEHKGNMASVVQQFFKQYKENKEIKIFERSETFERDFIFINDILDINVFFWANPQLKGIYNVGTGTVNSFQDIADVFKKRYDDLSVVTIPFPEELKNKYQIYTRADITKLRANGYGGMFSSLAAGVNEYLEYLEADEDGIY